MATARNLPSRLHHTAYVSKNLEETRKFYEDIRTKYGTGQ